MSSGLLVGVWPSATLYQRASLCLCVSSILLGLGWRQSNTSAHYITSIITHTQGCIDPLQLPALSSAAHLRLLAVWAVRSFHTIPGIPHVRPCVQSLFLDLCSHFCLDENTLYCGTNANLCNRSQSLLEFLCVCVWVCVLSLCGCHITEHSGCVDSQTLM